jgi:fumarylpyruvate hydrolase
MTAYVFAPPAVTSVAVEGISERFPVRRIYCVGRNYAAHVREAGFDPDREPPFFFMKPTDAIIESGATVPYPPETKNFQYEIELVIAIGKGGKNIKAADALNHIYGYTIGIDYTKRDVQMALRDGGRPWEWGKSFDHSAAISPIKRVADIGHKDKGRIWLAVNGTIKQDQDLADMIWKTPEIIEYCSKAQELFPGDLIYTGTPAGISPINIGDVVTGEIEGLAKIEQTIGKPK